MNQDPTLEVKKNLLEHLLSSEETIGSIDGPIKQIIDEEGEFKIEHDQQGHDSTSHDQTPG